MKFLLHLKGTSDGHETSEKELPIATNLLADLFSPMWIKVKFLIRSLFLGGTSRKSARIIGCSINKKLAE